MSSARKTFTVNDKGMAEFIYDIKSRLHLKEDDEIEVVQSLTQLTIVKKGSFCSFCGSDEDLRTLGKGRLFCVKCLEAMCEVLVKGAPEEEFRKALKEL